MARPPDRTGFYTSTGQVGVVAGQPFTFFSGSPTDPPSFTGNQILVAGGRGIGANLLNGARRGVPQESIECTAPAIESIGPPDTFMAGDGLVVVPVTYADPVVPGDIYQLFMPGFASTLRKHISNRTSSRA